MCPEHEAAVGFSGRQQNVGFKNEIGVIFIRHEEKFLICGEVDFTVDHFGLAPGVGIGPTGEGFAIEERDETIRCFFISIERRKIRRTNQHQRNETATCEISHERGWVGSGHRLGARSIQAR